MRRLEHTVTAAEAGWRADWVLRRTLRMSGTVIKRVKHLPGGILLDGEPVWPSFPVREGQRLSVLVGDTENGHAVPRPGELDIVYEDEDLVVVNKAPGVPTHPGPTEVFQTVGNYLTYRYNQMGLPHVYRPVNRLDAHTSGLMVAARHAHAHSLLKEQLHTADFRRRYLAVCVGTPQPPAGVVDAPIGEDETSYLRRKITPGGAPARTRYRVVGEREGLSLVALELETGRTHQIRLHMAHLNCPLAGDFLYGAEDRALIPRTALHSHRLDLRHPITGEGLSFTAPLPGDMARLFPVEGERVSWYDGDTDISI